MKLPERIETIRNLVWEITNYQDLLEYLSYDLHDSPSRIDQNEGLYFIWRSLMGLQILTLSKLIKDNGAFSLQKLINIAAAKTKGFDKREHQEEMDCILSEYEKHQLDVVRDKFVAHLDISSNEIKTDIHMLCVTANQVTSLFNRIASAVGAEEFVRNDRCVKGIKEIFSELDEYEKVKALIVATQIKGKQKIYVADFLAIKEC